MSALKCFKCGSEKIEAGSLKGSTYGGVPGDAVFKPNRKLRMFSFSWHDGIVVTSEAFCCRECGFLWGTIAPDKLSTFTKQTCAKESNAADGGQ